VISVGIAEKHLSQVRLFPNPATEQLRITLPAQKAELQIYDAGNRLIKTMIVSDQSYIDVTDLAQGFYLVKVENGAQHIVKRFVKR